jgi:predicted N-acyltransferase
LKSNLSFIIYKNSTELPEYWDVLASSNIFLSRKYLLALDQSAPRNMTCRYIGLFNQNKLVGIINTQLLNASQIVSFGINKNCIKFRIRNFLLKKFANNVLFIGNNMLTGQNAFLNDNDISSKELLNFIQNPVNQIIKDYKCKGIKVHIITYKDFSENDSKHFISSPFSKYYPFEVQPNMIFTNNSLWKTENDYVNSLTKKYRDHYKRARKKAGHIIKRQFSLEDILVHEEKLYELYLNVTKNAPFNTFYLTHNHFYSMKKNLQDNFLLYAYSYEGNLIGFNTLIVNNNSLDTYFLGYDEYCQKERMIYLNMLYDMVGYSISKGFLTINFGRTALEIKSSVGAKPYKVFGFMKHTNPMLNYFSNFLFSYFNLKIEWKERTPFQL